MYIIFFSWLFRQAQHPAEIVHWACRSVQLLH